MGQRYIAAAALPPPKSQKRGHAGRLPTWRKGPARNASSAELSRWMGGDHSARNTLVVELDHTNLPFTTLTLPQELLGSNRSG